MTNKNNPHRGSTLDDFLREEGIFESAKAQAITRVIAWQLSQEMERQNMTKVIFADKLQTSRAQVDRILKGKGNITLATLQRAAMLLGREVRLELVPLEAG